MTPRFFFLVLAGLAVTAVARAQTNSHSANAALPPIVISAEEEKPEPRSRSVIRMDAAETTQIRELENLPARAPNLSINSTSLHSFGDVYLIRGLGNTTFFSNPAIALYVD